MQLLSSTDLAIAVAIKAGTLSIERCEGRFGEFFAIGDERGIIEVALDSDEVDCRIEALRERLQ
jgi:hypothetical protein